MSEDSARVKEAEKTHRPISRIITDALVRQDEAEIQELMVEGYREWSKLHRKIAEEFWPIAGEILANESWPDD